MSKAVKNVHVVPRSGKWAVRTEGAVRATSTHSTKEQAVSAARSKAKVAATELVVHNKNGTISSRDSYARDPMPPKDRK